MRQWRAGITAAALLQALLCSAANAQSSGEPFLATVQTEFAAGAETPFPQRVQMTLHVADPAKSVHVLSSVTGIEIIEQQSDTVRISLGMSSTFAGDVVPQHTANSFVIDYDETAVRVLFERLTEEHDQPLTVADLTQSVFTHIGDKTYSRAFDLASRVAATGVGDCTEHAVLLTALARAQGYAARVVLGLLTIEDGDRFGAYGHAWAEIHDGDRWQIADGTFPPNDAGGLTLRYLPLSALENEGPGYTLGLMQQISVMPRKLTDIAPAG